MDDVTLGKMLTEAHRGQADFCGTEGMSVSQSSSSVRFDGSGQPDGEINVIDQGNLMSETAQTHRLGLYLKSRDRQLSRNIAKKSVITNSKQLTQKKKADSYKDNYGDRNWNFVKLINRNGRITEIPEFYVRYDRETKTHQGPEHYFGIIRKITGTAK